MGYKYEIHLWGHSHGNEFEYTYVWGSNSLLATLAIAWRYKSKGCKFLKIEWR